MSSIQTYLNNIINAVYGEDVRSSIKNAIQQCYSDVGSPTLNRAAFETAIQTKLDDGTVSSMISTLTASEKQQLIGLLDEAAPNVNISSDDESETDAPTPG